MKKEYEDIVQTVCKIGSWKATNMAERQGAVGVACVLAYLRGSPATIMDLAKTVGVPADDVEIPYKRLLVNGVFSNSYDIKNDIVLKGESEDEILSMPNSSECVLTSAEKAQAAWAILAGLASGFCGLRENNWR